MCENLNFPALMFSKPINTQDIHVRKPKLFCLNDFKIRQALETAMCKNPNFIAVTKFDPLLNIFKNLKLFSYSSLKKPMELDTQRQNQCILATSSNLLSSYSQYSYQWESDSQSEFSSPLFFLSKYPFLSHDDLKKYTLRNSLYHLPFTILKSGLPPSFSHHPCCVLCVMLPMNGGIYNLISLTNDSLRNFLKSGLSIF